jgi:hypothetical protein
MMPSLAARLLFAWHFTLGAPPHVVAGADGHEHRRFWVLTDACSEEWLARLDVSHGAVLRQVGFHNVACWKRHANQLPITRSLEKE